MGNGLCACDKNNENNLIKKGDVSLVENQDNKNINIPNKHEQNNINNKKNHESETSSNNHHNNEEVEENENNNNPNNNNENNNNENNNNDENNNNEEEENNEEENSNKDSKDIDEGAEDDEKEEIKEVSEREEDVSNDNEEEKKKNNNDELVTKFNNMIKNYAKYISYDDFHNMIKPDILEKEKNLDIINQENPKIKQFIDDTKIVDRPPLLFTDGVAYKGMWNINGQKEGFGILIDKEGNKYIGGRKEDKLNRYGRIISKNGEY